MACVWQVDTCWDNNLVEPWDCWSMSDCDGPLEVPLNQCQESYQPTTCLLPQGWHVAGGGFQARP